MRNLDSSFVIAATDLVESLGWQPRSGIGARSRAVRAEARFANILDVQFPHVRDAYQKQDFPDSPETCDDPEPASDEWCASVEALLRRYGLHVQGVPGETIFSHTPSKRRNVQEQKRLLEKAGVYHTLSFGWEQTAYKYNAQPDGPCFVTRGYFCTVNAAARDWPRSNVLKVDTWEELFVFQAEFDAYNKYGMVEADPQASRWCSEKQCFDYTPFVTRADWLSRFRDQHQREVNRAMLRRGRTPPHKWISSQWACGLEAEGPELGNDATCLYGPSSSIWHEVVPEASTVQEAFSIAVDSGYSPIAPYAAFTRSGWERNCQYWNTQTYEEVLGKYAQWTRDDWLSKSPPKCFWETWCAVAS